MGSLSRYYIILFLSTIIIDSMDQRREMVNTIPDKETRIVSRNMKDAIETKEKFSKKKLKICKIFVRIMMLGYENKSNIHQSFYCRQPAVRSLKK